MVGIGGIVFLLVCVFGSFIVGGGSLAPFIHAAPIEGWCILGSGIGGMLIGNSLGTTKAVFAGIGRTFKGSKYHKEDYLNTIFCVSKVMKTLKSEGAVALEAHIEAPESSAIFSEYPKILHDHALLHLICDTVRLMVVSQGTLSPMAVEEVMDNAIKTHHHDELKASTAIGTLAGALPALGIVSCVMGVVKTMEQIDQPPRFWVAWWARHWWELSSGCFWPMAFLNPLPSAWKKSSTTKPPCTAWSSKSSSAPCTAIPCP